MTKFSVFGLVLLSLALGGCSNLRLYSEVRDKQGEAARKAWSEVDLKGVVDAERANLKKLLDAELDTQDRLATGIRNHELRYMVQSDSVQVGLVTPLEARLSRLVGSGTLPGSADLVGLSESQKKQQNLRTEQLKAHETNKVLRMNRLDPPSCTEIANEAVPEKIQKWLTDPSRTTLESVAVDSSLKQLRLQCTATNNFSDAGVYASLNGALGVAWAEYRQGAEVLAGRKAAAKPLQDEYRKALAEYENVVAESEGKPDAEAKVKAAAAKIERLVETLERAADAFSAKFLSEERLKSLEAFTKAVTETQPGKDPPKDASKAAVAFIVIPRFFDGARAELAESKKPLAVPLLIRRNYEQLNLEAANRDIAASEAIVRLSRELVDVLYQQAEQLQLARTELHQPAVVTRHKELFSDALTKSGADEREALYSAAGRYLDAVSRLDAKRYKLEYMRVAAYHERALAYAEVNVKQWESLIGTTVNQVADYSASGFKAEQIANLLNTLGILYIGVGVNK